MKTESVPHPKWLRTNMFAHSVVSWTVKQSSFIFSVTIAGFPVLDSVIGKWIFNVSVGFRQIIHTYGVTCWIFPRLRGGCHSQRQQDSVRQPFRQPELLCQSHDGQWWPSHWNLCQTTNTSWGGTLLWLSVSGVFFLICTLNSPYIPIIKIYKKKKKSMAEWLLWVLSLTGFVHFPCSALCNFMLQLNAILSISEKIDTIKWITLYVARYDMTNVLWEIT